MLMEQEEAMLVLKKHGAHQPYKETELPENITYPGPERFLVSNEFWNPDFGNPPPLPRKVKQHCANLLALCKSFCTLMIRDTHFPPLPA